MQLHRHMSLSPHAQTPTEAHRCPRQSSRLFGRCSSLPQQQVPRPRRRTFSIGSKSPTASSNLLWHPLSHTNGSTPITGFIQPRAIRPPLLINPLIERELSQLGGSLLGKMYDDISPLGVHVSLHEDTCTYKSTIAARWEQVIVLGLSLAES